MKTCACGGSNIRHSEAVGKGLTPKGYKQTNKLVSWKGIWDVWTCLDCGKEVKQLRKS